MFKRESSLTNSMDSNTSSPLFLEVPTDDSGIPYCIGLLRDDVFESVLWHYPVDTTAPIPSEITRYLLSKDIVAAPGCTFHLKISDLPLPPLPDPDSDSGTESHASSVTDSSRGHQSYDRNFARLDSAPSADLNLGREEVVHSGDEFESEAEENAPDDGNVIIENVPIDVQEEENEQASAATGSQHGSDLGDPYFIDFNDGSTFPPFPQFLKLISDKLVKWIQEDRAAAWHIWTLYKRNTLPSTRIELDQLKLTKQLVDLRFRFEIFRRQDFCLHRGDWFDTKGFPFTRFEQIFAVPRTRYRAPCEFCGETSVWFDFKQDQSAFRNHKFIHAFPHPPNPFLQPQPLQVECRRGRPALWLEVHANCINTF